MKTAIEIKSKNDIKIKIRMKINIEIRELKVVIITFTVPIKPARKIQAMILFYNYSQLIVITTIVHHACDHHDCMKTIKKMIKIK